MTDSWIENAVNGLMGKQVSASSYTFVNHDSYYFFPFNVIIFCVMKFWVLYAEHDSDRIEFLKLSNRIEYTIRTWYLL